MAYHVIGLDRGTCAVKAVILERSFRGYEVKGTRLVPVPQDGSGPPSAEAVQAAVAELVSEFDPGAVGYITDYPGRMASSWFVQLPFTDQRRIDQTLPFELENFVPFDLEDMILDYRVVRSQGGKARVVSAMAPKTEVRSALQGLKSLKVDPRALLLDGYALCYVPPGKESSEKSLAIVDIGHTQTLVTVRSAGQADFMRTIPLGGLRVTQALMQTFGVNYRTAERIKQTLAPVEPIGDDTQAMQPVEPHTAMGEIEWEDDLGPRAAEPGEVTAVGLRPDMPAGLGEAEGDDTVDRFFAAMETTSGRRAYGGPESLGGYDASDLPGPSGLEVTPVVVATLPAETTAPVPYPPQTVEEIERVVTEAMVPVLAEIRNALMAYEALERREIGAVLLVGGGSMLRDLASSMSEDLGIPVGPPVRLGPDQVTVEPESELPRFALPFALGYLGATDGRIGELNFRQGEFAYRKNYQALRGYLLAGLALALIGVFVLTGVFFSKARTLHKSSDALDARITAAVKAAFPDLPIDPAKGLEHAMALMLEEHTKLQDRGKLLGVGVVKRKSLDVLREISSVLPPREEVKIDVEDFDVQGDQLKMRGTTDSFETVDRIQKSIQSSPMVKEVKNPEVSGAADRKKFTLSITLKEPEDAGSGS